VSDLLDGGPGRDVLRAGDNEEEAGVEDYLFGREGDDKIYGGAFGYGNIWGGEGDDFIDAWPDDNSAGDWDIWGDDGDDVIRGAGNDRIYGGKGDDRLYGMGHTEPENDPPSNMLYGDFIRGGEGDDIISATDLKKAT
jgi:Ca2+-binding RTX toxin-like protein